MKTLCFALLVLVLFFSTSPAEAGPGFSVQVYGGGVFVESAPPAVVYTPPSIVYVEPQQVGTYWYQSCGGDCGSYYYEGGYKHSHHHKHKKHHKHHPHDDD